LGIIQNGGQEKIVVFKSCVILSGKCQKGIDLLRFGNAVSFFRCEDYVKEKGFSDRKSRTGREIHPHRVNFAPRPAVCEKTNDLFGKKHHDLVAALHELAHGVDGQRLVGQHCQVIELLAEHRNVLGILVLENVFDQCMVRV